MRGNWLVMVEVRRPEHVRLTVRGNWLVMVEVRRPEHVRLTVHWTKGLSDPFTGSRAFFEPGSRRRAMFAVKFPHEQSGAVVDSLNARLDQLNSQPPSAPEWPTVDADSQFPIQVRSLAHLAQFHEPLCRTYHMAYSLLLAPTSPASVLGSETLSSTCPQSITCCPAVAVAVSDTPSKLLADRTRSERSV
jgi:hypothetical protein